MKIEKIDARILGMYFGQKIEFIEDDKFFDIGSIMEINHVVLFSIIEENATGFVLHLRSLKSITEEEVRCIYNLVNGEEWEENPFGDDVNDEDYSPALCRFDWWLDDNDRVIEERWVRIGDSSVWLYLLSKGFDLFDLIDAGLAKEMTQI